MSQYFFQFHILLNVLAVLLFKFAQLTLKLVALFHFSTHAVDGRLGVFQLSGSFAKDIYLILN